MRRLVALLTITGLASTAGVGAQTAVTRAQLSVMVLSLSAYGPEAAKLSVDPSSGFQPNAKAASTIDPAVTSAYLTRIGRVIGYKLAFTSPSGIAPRSG